MKRITSARISQLLFLVLFLVLFINTEYRGRDEINAAVNAFFRADPLVAAAYLLAAKTFTWLLLPAVLLLVATALLGRFFCGWICPLGTILDLLGGRFRRRGAPSLFTGNAKYWVLLPLLGAALAGINLAGLLDPLAILVRGLAFSLHPLLGDTTRGAWVGLYRVLGEGRDLLAPGYALIRDHVLPFRETAYPLAFLSALILAVVIGLEGCESRCWCRRLCPLGTLLGLAARFSPFNRRPEKLCADCRACSGLCPTSFDREILQKEECILCMECAVRCPSARVRFLPGSPLAGEGPLLPQRRVLLGGVIGGLLAARFFRFRDPAAQARVLRPPGVRDEGAFLAACVRCGECMKVCLRSALYPAVLQSGVEGLYTPVLIPRLGYCEYNCTLCGQVCPTGAIPNLPVPAKKREVIGKAVFDRNHCLPFAKKINCIVCEEHCPIPAKAIRSRRVLDTDDQGRQVELLVPYVVDELCNGCGICENVCPVEGKAGIEVFAVKDRTPLREFQGPVPVEKGGDPYG
ncbi:(4Fe-4S)-binding protein [Geobacter sulfurreducens]|nr:(4Fe-4S)-binding protein [Geobacter sulfurreducens]